MEHTEINFCKKKYLRVLHASVVKKCRKVSKN